ncbi:hypothetical protein GF345_04475 [Candidatus Woesearchaeota archaeon]|nr:hypothetical protein [Candidatus Woesearchaeota archaeon]
MKTKEKALSNLKLYKAVFASLLSGFLIGLIVTDALQSRIFFSLFIGIPAGLLTAAAVFAVLMYIEYRCSQENKSRKKDRQ